MLFRAHESEPAVHRCKQCGREIHALRVLFIRMGCDLSSSDRSKHNRDQRAQAGTYPDGRVRGRAARDAPGGVRPPRPGCHRYPSPPRGGYDAHGRTGVSCRYTGMSTASRN
jgi:hypothetical protein